MSSNHCVVRIYPLVLPPVTLFPSLHPSCLFPSLCCRSSGHQTTLNTLQPLFLPSMLPHWCSAIPGTRSFASSFLLSFLSSLALLRVWTGTLQLTSTGLPFKCSLGRTERARSLSPSICEHLCGKRESICFIAHQADAGVWLRRSHDGSNRQ